MTQVSLASVQWDVPVILLGILAFLLAAVIAHRSSYYRRLIDEEAASSRFHAVDGLRGYLGLGVLLHHTAINYQYYQSGSWTLVPSNLEAFLGRGAVAFFFMITAFLFWNRVIDEDGRMSAYKFYVSRVRRIVPMYSVAAGLTVMTALALTDFRLKVPLLSLAGQILAWMLFTIPGAPDINNFTDTALINTVFWSLELEWHFYIVLPLLAVIAHPRPRYRWYPVIFAAIYLWFYSTTQFEWFFLAGCLAARLTRYPMVKGAATSLISTVVAIGGIAAAIAFVPMVYSFAGAALLFIPFVVFASGNTLFGALTCRPARLLGLVSYSVYVLHNWVLFVVSRLVDQFADVGSMPASEYWVLGAVMVLMTVVLSAITFRFVESPWLRSSRQVKPVLKAVDISDGLPPERG